MYCPKPQQSRLNPHYGSRAVTNRRLSVKSSQGDYSLQQNNSCRVAISFGWTSEQLFKGKSVTRRCWKDSYAQQFINRWQRGINTYIALDKSWRWGGKQIGTITLTCCPYQERLSEMPPSDLAAEGFPELSQQEFIQRFFKGNDQQQVWVIRFRFTPLAEESCSTRISSKLDTEGDVENGCSTRISSNLDIEGDTEDIGSTPGDNGCSTRISPKPYDTKVSVTDYRPLRLLLTEPDYLSEKDGQLTIFSNDEPPEPDDFKSLEDFKQAWAKWELQYPELAEAVRLSNKGIQTIRVEQKSHIRVEQPSQTEVTEHSRSETIQPRKTRNTKPGRGSRPKQVKCNVKRNGSKGKAANSYWVYKFSFKIDGKYYNRSCSIPKDKVNRAIEMWESKQYCWRDIVEYIGKNPDVIMGKTRGKNDDNIASFSNGATHILSL